jgi:hypothetical protein
MRNVILIDTSVYLNILKVPGFDQQQQTVHTDFRQYISGNARPITPSGTNRTTRPPRAPASPTCP